MSLDAEKNKALDAALKQIEKDFGKGSIMKLGAASAKMNIETDRNLPGRPPWPCT